MTQKIIWGILFYALFISLWIYMQGKWPFNSNKKEEYKRWVNSKGKKSSKYILIIIIIYSIVFVFNLFLT